MDILEIRKDIDDIDQKIVSLLNERFSLSYKIKEYKNKSDYPIIDKERESQIISTLSKSIISPMKLEYLKNIYSEIFSASRDLQKETKVAFFGLEYSYTHIAAKKFFGSSSLFFANDTIEDVFKMVQNKNALFGVVPIENSTEGSVNNTLDLFLDSEVKIFGEIYLDIHHNLISLNDDIKELKKVYSHPQGLAQTRIWCHTNLKNVEFLEATSTTKAVELAKLDKSIGAIASFMSAEKNNMNILAKNIEDKPNNQTKFLIISLMEPKKAKKNKTSIVFTIKDKVGALFDMLLPFFENNINLTKIESRPTKRKAWEYVFFANFIGHKDDEIVKKAMHELEKKCLFLKILGSYPLEEF